MKFNIKLISFFCIFSLIFIVGAFAQTRNNAISEAGKYITNCQWTVNQNNIIDIGSLVGSTANDGYDDRMGKVDEDGNGTISPQELEKALTRWPFKKGETYAGEAYAWAGYSGEIKWGADTVRGI